MHLNMLILEKTAHATKPTKTESTLEVMLMLPHKTLMLFMKLLLSPQSRNILILIFFSVAINAGSIWF